MLLPTLFAVFCVRCVCVDQSCQRGQLFRRQYTIRGLCWKKAAEPAPVYPKPSRGSDRRPPGQGHQQERRPARRRRPRRPRQISRPRRRWRRWRRWWRRRHEAGAWSVKSWRSRCFARFAYGSVPFLGGFKRTPKGKPPHLFFSFFGGEGFPKTGTPHMVTCCGCARDLPHVS